MTARTVFAIALVMAVALGASACGGHSDPLRKLKPPAVIVIRPQRGPAVRTLTLPGDLIGYYESTLYAKVTGYLKTISVDKGDWVKKGQVLATIEVPELSESLARAKANLEIQRVTYQRLHRVWKTDPRLVAGEDVDIAQGKYAEAQAEVEELQAMVGYTSIVAPFTGVITGRFVDPGALVKGGGGAASSEPFAIGSSEGSISTSGAATRVLSEAMIDRMRVYVYVPQGLVDMVRRGLPATLTIQDFPHRVFRGNVTRYSDSLDLSTRTMLTEVDLENPRHLLYPGMYANVTLQLERHPDALKLPDSAVQSGPSGSFTYVVRDGRLAKVPVKTGINTGTYVEITSGLSGDEKVVATINPALVPGQRVRAIIQPSRQAGSTALAKQG